MAIPKVKGTYSLDLETIRRLEQVAERWGVSKSEALRRAIHAASGQQSPAVPQPLEVFQELVHSLALTESQADGWTGRARAERSSASRRREGRPR